VTPGCRDACGGAGKICLEAEGAVKSVNWRAVGQGNGRFDAVEAYNFVGQGQGSFERTEVATPYGWKFRPTCMAISLLLLLAAVVVVFFIGGSVTTTTTALATGPPGDCIIWGDPHFETFDHTFPNLYDEGEFWIVKSAEISIQGRFLATQFTNGLAATHQIVVGGAFLQGHTIQIGPMENGQITLDGQPILQQFPSSLTLPNKLGSVSFDGTGQLVDSGMESPGMQKKIVHMSLPDNTHLQVMRWANHLNVKVTMTPRGNQDGACGNFNGIPDDDSTDQIKTRLGGRIPLAELIFHAQAQVAAPGSRPALTLDDCPTAKKAEAQVKCELATPQAKGQLEDSCVFDVCFGGDQYAVEDGLSESQATA